MHFTVKDAMQVFEVSDHFVRPLAAIFGQTGGQLGSNFGLDVRPFGDFVSDHRHRVTRRVQATENELRHMAVDKFIRQIWKENNPRSRSLETNFQKRLFPVLLLDFTIWEIRKR